MTNGACSGERGCGPLHPPFTAFFQSPTSDATLGVRMTEKCSWVLLGMIGVVWIVRTGVGGHGSLLGRPVQHGVEMAEVAGLVGPLAQYSQEQPNVSGVGMAVNGSPPSTTFRRANVWPDLSFGYQDAQTLSERQTICLIKWAWGGTNSLLRLEPGQTAGGWCFKTQVDRHECVCRHSTQPILPPRSPVCCGCRAKRRVR